LTGCEVPGGGVSAGRLAALRRLRLQRPSVGDARREQTSQLGVVVENRVRDRHVVLHHAAVLLDDDTGIALEEGFPVTEPSRKASSPSSERKLNMFPFIEVTARSCP